MAVTGSKQRQQPSQSYGACGQWQYALQPAHIWGHNDLDRRQIRTFDEGGSKPPPVKSSVIRSF
eukprot:359849-Chlamydomonas_euryale.AAC.7